jgi:Na+(H+)/acetate symporter ActP
LGRADELVAPIVITALAYLHVLAAMGWLGGAILFVSSIAPGLRSLSPTASLEFLAKVGPRSTRFFAGTATATIVFGLALLKAWGEAWVLPEILAARR